MRLPAIAWNGRPGMAELLRVLEADKGETRYVGGCVRDSLLALPVNDIDLATRLAPEEVFNRLKRSGFRAIPTGIAHGTITAVLADGPVEITTLRRDVTTDGRRATIAYTDDWKEDAARRDFTINALFADAASGEILDFFGGTSDLEARLVRFIGDPLQRIAEDHLRILRFFRFHARFGNGQPDAPALEACRLRANDLMALSRERIADELLKLLALPDPVPTIRLMVGNEILRPVLPEIDAAGAARLVRLAERERMAAVAPDPLRRFAALLPQDAETAASMGARLRLSKRAAKRLVSAVAGSFDGGAPEALAYRIGVEETIDRILLGDCDLAALDALSGWTRPRLPLGGGDLILMGLPTGPLVAQTLQSVEREWMARGFPADEEEVRAIARTHVDQALRANQ